MICLNYSVLLYKTKERRNAAKQFAAYEKRLDALKRNGRAAEIDAQVRRIWRCNGMVWYGMVCYVMVYGMV